MGYRVPENFNRPYLSANLVEFWRRWHITLSEWIRLRLMMKMVGRRSPTRQLYAATVIAMAACGLWHGAGWNFLVWGLWHGVGLVAVHAFGTLQRRVPRLFELSQSRPWTWAAVGMTFAYVTAGWIVFFLPIDQAEALVRRMMAYDPALPGALAVPAGIALLALVFAARELPGRVWSRCPRPLRGMAISAALASVVYLLLFGGLGTQEFVYSQF
jgi:D-alanyl-lipoteichoic acid acyltransferase DltB (MBOAT superfamily)